jgi:hypothetical protein
VTAAGPSTKPFHPIPSAPPGRGRHCHLPVQPKPRLAWNPTNGRFTPELAAAIDDDPNLNDGARRCARKIAEYTYRRNRDIRECQIAVSYLARAPRRSARTVQRYLRQIEHIETYVLASHQTQMCVGLAIQMSGRFFPSDTRKNGRHLQ